MKEKITIADLQGKKEIKGCVAISYINPHTGKVKERFTGENKVFMEQFATGRWFFLLNATAGVHMVMTDDTAPANDNFQYMRGNIIGYGINGTVAPNIANNLGAYIPSKSWNAKIIIRGYSWKYTYSFTEDQATIPIKSIGITAQYGPAFNYPIATIPYSRESVGYLFIEQRGYRVTGGIVTIYDPLTDSGQTNFSLDLISIIGNTVNQSLFYDFQTGKFYIYTYNATAGNRRLYEFSDDTFITLLNTYTPSNYALNGIYTGAAYGGKLYTYQSTGNINKFDYINNTASVNIPLPTNPISAYSNVFMNTKSVLITHNGLAYWHDSRNNNASVLNPIFDIANESTVASFANGDNGNSSNVAGLIIENPFSAYNTPIISSYDQQIWQTRNALTCYNIPLNAPARPPGMAMTVEYTIEVEYQG